MTQRISQINYRDGSSWTLRHVQKVQETDTHVDVLYKKKVADGIRETRVVEIDKQHLSSVVTVFGNETNVLRFRNGQSVFVAGGIDS